MIMNRKYFSRLPQKITNFCRRLFTRYQDSSVFQHIKTVIPAKTLLLALTTIGFFVFSLIIPNNKVFFVLSTIYIVSQFIITKSFIATLLYSFIPLSIFSIGQTYTFLAVPKAITFSRQYPEGRTLSFVFSPYIVLLLSGVGVTFVSLFHWKKGLLRFNLVILALFFTIAFIVFSAQQTAYFQVFSMVNSLRWLSGGTLVLLFANYYKSLNIRQRVNAILTLFSQITLTLLFISSIVLLQFIKRAPLGLTIESTKVSPLFGAAADESTLVFRPTGLTPHANMMANGVFLLALSLVIIYQYLPSSLRSSRPIQSLFVITSLSSLLVIIISQSRSVYLGVLLFITLFLIWDYSTIISIVKLTRDRFRKLKVTGVLLLLAVFLVIANRAWYSFYSFSETGGIAIRRELNQEAINLVRKYPIWGVGPGMFIPALAGENPTGVIKKFPESVHNGFLLFIAENGLLAQGALLVFIFLLIKKLFLSQLSTSFKKIVTIGLIAQLVPMFFQPLINYFSVYTMIILIVLF